MVFEVYIKRVSLCTTIACHTRDLIPYVIKCELPNVCTFLRVPLLFHEPVKILLKWVLNNCTRN